MPSTKRLIRYLPQIAPESYRGNHIKQGVFTQPGPKSDVTARRFWIARKPETHLFSTEACSIALSRGRLRTRFNTRAIGKFSIGSTVANSGMYDYVYPW